MPPRSLPSSGIRTKLSATAVMSQIRKLERFLLVLMAAARSLRVVVVKAAAGRGGGRFGAAQVLDEAREGGDGGGEDDGCELCTAGWRMSFRAVWRYVIMEVGWSERCEVERREEVAKKTYTHIPVASRNPMMSFDLDRWIV